MHSLRMQFCLDSLVSGVTWFTLVVLGASRATPTDVDTGNVMWEIQLGLAACKACMIFMGSL